MHLRGAVTIRVEYLAVEPLGILIFLYNKHNNVPFTSIVLKVLPIKVLKACGNSE